jgi:flagellar biosynthetic protein FliR
MQGELTFPVATVYSFLLVLARIGGTFIFVPIPGVRNVMAPVRVVLIMAITLSLYPLWPEVTGDPSLVQYAGWMMGEAVFGMGIGLLVALLSEAMILFGQISGMQAGYSFASTVDPNTQADSTVLIVIADTVGSLLFFSTGLHHQVIRIFAHSLESHPPGALLMGAQWSGPIIHAMASVFTTGLRLALPVIALLMMVDLTLAMLGRINSQLQLLNLAFPIKMMSVLAMLAILLPVMPRLYQGMARQLFTFADAFVGK